jgi:hypothetical protein
VEAGTTASSRVRGEFNSWNLLQIEPGRVVVQRFTWNGRTFDVATIEDYLRAPTGWRPAPPSPRVPESRHGDRAG